MCGYPTFTNIPQVDGLSTGPRVLGRHMASGPGRVRGLDNKEAIAWSVEDSKGINPSICMHKILMEDNGKTSIEHQRRLNPIMKKIVRKEVLKWLNVGFIYVILDSPWVSLIHVVPKKGGFRMIRNEKNELIHTRTVTG